MVKNSNAAPAIPAMGEGEIFLFVRFNSTTGAFQVLYTDLLTALSLHSMAETSLELEKQKAMAPAVQIASPGPLPNLGDLRA